MLIMDPRFSNSTCSGVSSGSAAHARSQDAPGLTAKLVPVDGVHYEE